MKKLILSIIVLILTVNVSYGQVELWPKENASWYYFKYTFGIETYVNYSIDRDTIIQGKNCQVYTKYKKVIDYLSNYEFENTESVGKIICLEDSVLYNYDFSIDQFDTIINFNANIGDTWSGFLTSPCFNANQDTSFVVTLTNKSIETIQGVDFNTYELTYSSPNLAQPFVFDFYQLLGTLYGGELNEFDNCDFIEAAGTSTNCFLYHENGNNEFIYHRNAKINEDGCDYVPSLGLTDEETYGFSIVNPVKENKIYILNPGHIEIDNIQLLNSLGQNIKVEISYNDNQVIGIMENKVESGVYYCKIWLSSGKNLIKKIIIE